MHNCKHAQMHSCIYRQTSCIQPRPHGPQLTLQARFPIRSYDHHQYWAQIQDVVDMQAARCMVQKARCKGDMPYCQMQDAKMQAAKARRRLQDANAIYKCDAKWKAHYARCNNAKCHVQECKRAQSKVKNLTMLMFGYLYESLGDTIYNHWYIISISNRTTSNYLWW